MPLIKAIFSPAVGQMLGLVIMLGVYIYALRVVWRNRKLLRERLLLRAQHASAFFGTLLRMLARIWHLLAIAYFTVLLGASQLAPDRALPFMVQATLQSLLAIAIALVLSAVLTRVAARRIELPGAWRNRLPLLERRLNAYVPAALKGLRLLLLVLATLVVLDAWQVFDLSASLASDRGRAAIFMLVRIGIVLLIAVGSWTLVASVIEHRLSLNGTSPGQPSARERTLLTLFRNAAMVVIVTMTVLVLLAQIGIDIGPLIAGAGVVGLAIGFGAQKLVQDIITGVFIQLENGMNQNDVVEVAGVFGTVEKLTIRSVGIRTLDGAYHLVPFSSVDTVVNHMRDFSYHVGEYTIAHRENVDDAVVHLKAAFAELQQDEGAGARTAGRHHGRRGDLPERARRHHPHPDQDHPGDAMGRAARLQPPGQEAFRCRPHRAALSAPRAVLRPGQERQRASHAHAAGRSRPAGGAGTRRRARADARQAGAGLQAGQHRCARQRTGAGQQPGRRTAQTGLSALPSGRQGAGLQTGLQARAPSMNTSTVCGGCRKKCSRLIATLPSMPSSSSEHWSSTRWASNEVNGCSTEWIALCIQNGCSNPRRPERST
ncbi:mechanosensitive ion channel domain-containing protein [Bordetella trematum]|uniref:mechanosensitive ion channel domain-containing protein n=1 Tax=Bordetella trematum TaxID=123899 RepID=UPI003AF3A65F